MNELTSGTDDLATSAAAALAFDTVSFNETAQLLGQEKMASYLNDLARLLERRLAGAAELSDRRRCQRDAHILVSVGGMLGFGELSAACRQLDSAEPEDVDTFLAELDTVRDARDRALQQIRRLLLQMHA